MDRIQQIRQHQQRAAENIVLTYLLAEHFRRSGNPDEASRLLLMTAEVAGAQMTYGNLDPAESDLAAQELREALTQIVLRAKSLAGSR